MGVNEFERWKNKTFLSDLRWRVGKICWSIGSIGGGLFASRKRVVEGEKSERRRVGVASLKATRLGLAGPLPVSPARTFV